MSLWRNGRRSRFKICWGKPRAGSSPASGTLHWNSGCRGKRSCFPCFGVAALLAYKFCSRYELLNSAGTVVLTGRKQAFCLEDYTKIDPNAGLAKYTCSNQGIQVGWADVYGSYLDCQWLDVTGIPSGTYQLKVTVNATPAVSTKLTESDYSNNSATVAVTIK